MDESLDKKIDSVLKPISDSITNFIFDSFSLMGSDVPYIVCWLLIASLFFTFYFNFLNIRFFKRAVKVALGKYDDPSHPGEITHFQSFTAAMSGTIGLGNIAGVAVAIQLGGPGAIFWMWLTAIVGIATKFFTCTLSVMYRDVNPDGTTNAGPMYVIKNALPNYMLPLAYFFAIFGIIGL